LLNIPFYAIIDDERDVIARSHERAQGSSMAKQSILIVDDGPYLPSLLQPMLSSLSGDIEIKVAGSGREAEEKAQRETFDVVIANMFMQEMTGLELACLLQLVAPQTRFILITDHHLDIIEEAARLLQIYEYLVKPFSYYRLREIVQKALQSSADEKRRLGYMSRYSEHGSV